MNGQKVTLNSFVYLVTSIVSQAISILMIPIFTKNMSVSQFGEYNIVISVQSMMAIFVTLGVYSGFARFFNEFTDKNELKNMTLTFSLVFGGIIVGISFLASRYITVIKESEIYPYVIFIVLNSVLESCIAVYLTHFSMEFKAMKTSTIRIFDRVLTVASIVIFLVVFKQGIIGVLKGQFVAKLLVFSGLIIYDYKNLYPVLKIKELKSMLRFSVGLIPGNASDWILTLIDRYFINSFMDLGAVAIYSMGYKIASLIQLVFIMPFANAFEPYKFKVYKQEDGREKIRKAYRIFNFLSWLMILGISVYARIAIKVLSTETYAQAYKVVPIISISYYLYGLYMFYCIGFQIANKTIIESVIMICAAAVNVALNFVLIPAYGIYGAAISTIISYLMVNVAYFTFGRKYYDLNISVLEPLKYLLLFLPLYIAYVSVINGNVSMYVEFVINGVICAAFVLLSILFRLIDYGTILKIVNMVARILKKSKAA